MDVSDTQKRVLHSEVPLAKGPMMCAAKTGRRWTITEGKTHVTATHPFHTEVRTAKVLGTETDATGHRTVWLDRMIVDVGETLDQPWSAGGAVSTILYCTASADLSGGQAVHHATEPGWTGSESGG